MFSIGLDPAGPYFETPILSRLFHADANFVHVIHTSNEFPGKLVILIFLRKLKIKET